MELLDLYKEENKNLLYAISWLNKNSLFDKSIGKFREIDLFTFLEKINQFNYNEDLYFDDFYYVLEYTENSILHLINNLNKEIKRAHKVIPISEAKELDNKSILWISKQNGRNIREKLSKGKVKAVKRYEKLDTYENRVFKIFLKKILEVYENRNDIQYKFENLFIKIRRFLKSDNAKEINEHGKIIYNNILLHHPHYNKIFKSYKKIFNLNEIYDIYLNSFESIIKTIIKFETLSQFQFTTKVPILAKNLEIHRAKYQINLQNPLIQLYPLYLEKVIESVYESLNGYNLNLIRNKITEIINKELNFIYFRSRRSKQRIPKDISFKINIKNDDEIFIDIFQLFPIANINDEIIKFPIFLKQKIDNKLINANNTKIIDLNYDFYSLSEILETFDKNIFKYFLDYFSSIFLNNKLYYVIPDFVNIFEFSEFKKMINLYFKQNNAIPKSILAGFQYIYNKQPKKNKVLFYIQKNIKNDLYVTPLLIKYDEKLKNISKGFFLERYPTKKVENLELDNSLNELFDEEDLEIISNKFKEDELKNIKEKNICFYKNKDIITLKDIKFTSIKFNNLKKIKELYPLLKDKESIIIDYDSEAILSNFQKIVNYEKKGYILWKEHLPNLSLEVFKDGYYDEFVLIDNKTRLIDNKLEIKEHFIIPVNIKELTLPLIFENNSIGIEAYITSKEMPFKNDVECKLELTYNYESENVYELKFIPINKKINPLTVFWKKMQIKEYKKLPYPSFPEKKSWEELQNDTQGNKNSNLLEWVTSMLEWLDFKIPPSFIIEKENQEIISKLKEVSIITKKQDRAGNFYYFARLNNEKDVFCHSSEFINKNIDFSKININDKIYLIPKQNKKDKEKLNGTYIALKEEFEDKILLDKLIKKNIIEKWIFQNSKKNFEEKTQKLIKPLNSIKVPLLKIWKDKQLNDTETPLWFKEKMKKYIKLAEEIFFNEETNEKARENLKFFLSSIREDTTNKFNRYLIALSENRDYLLKNHLYLALSLGDLELEWQQIIFKNIVDYFKKESYPQFLKILSISLWRSEKILNYLNDSINDILEYLYSNLNDVFNIYKSSKKINYQKTLISLLELLLAIFVLRKYNENFLNPNDELTQKFYILINKIIKFSVKNNIKINSRIEIEVNKPKDMEKVAEILFAIRIYLTGDEKQSVFIKLKSIEEL